MTAFASRAGNKLIAAIDHFGLSSAIVDAKAIDVGASTGGFTDVLLRKGAAEVTAIDGGHGQMRQALASDRRVHVLERSNFKTLPLHVAPGPFDFFTVDVSFVAARSMMRPLAFRLRKGAMGVVLVKPQFELPKAIVPKHGISESASLRQFAVRRFRAKAERFGFELLGALDSPVPGGSGNVEVLVPLRYDGDLAVGAPGGAARSESEATGDDD